MAASSARMRSVSAATAASMRSAAASSRASWRWSRRAASPSASASRRRVAPSASVPRRYFSARTSSTPTSAMAASSSPTRTSSTRAFYNGARGLLRNVPMPTTRLRARRTTIRAILDTAIELEKRTMALYVGFVKAFPRPEEVRNFWFTMARHEAGHCGALALVESVVDSDPRAAARARVWFDPTTVTRLRSLLGAYVREARAGVSLERAFEMAIDLEASELEDVVIDMLSVVKDAEWRQRAIQLLIHDLGDLSYMIERHTRNESLLARADALVEQAAGRLARRRRPAPT